MGPASPLKLFPVLALLLATSLILNTTIAEDVCASTGRIKTRLQVAFVVDRTYTFRNFFRRFGAIVGEFSDRISKTFPDSEIAVTSFADYTSTQRYDETDKCYSLDATFTTEFDLLRDAIDRIGPIQGNNDNPENGLQAVMFTGADKEIGWKVGNYDGNGTNIQRVIVLLTDADDLITKGVRFKDERRRHPPLGDGTDDCTNSLYPNYSLISQVLKRKNIRILAGLGKSRETPRNIKQLYTQHFTTIGVDFELFDFELDNPRTLAADLEKVIYRTVPCKPPPPPPDQCGPNGRIKTRLQVAFVVDRTSSFQEFFNKLPGIINDFYGRISKTFPGSELALATFGDFWNTQRPQLARYDETDLCFTLDHSFTTNLRAINGSISKVIDSKQWFGDDFPENSLQAMMLALADKKIGWNNVNKDANGVYIQRVVILMTDADDLITKGANFLDKDKRHAAKGDGSDTCSNSLYPDYSLMARVLREKNAHVIGAMAVSDGSPNNIIGIYGNHFTQMSADYNLFDFPLNNPISLAANMESAIYQIIPCKPPAPPPPEKCAPEDRVPTKLQVAFVVDRTSSFQDFFKELGDIINDFYKRITKIFPGSELALTTFGDFLRPSQRPSVSVARIEEYDAATYCFTLNQLFTQKISEINISISKVIEIGQFFGDDLPENSLQAVMFTAAHKGIRWKVLDYDSDGVAIQRVIIMMTDADDLITKGAGFLDAEKRHPAIGDGSDDCINSLYPSYALMSQVLRAKGIHIIGALAKSGLTPPNIHEIYDSHFTKMSVDHNLFEFPLNNPITLAADMERAIYQTIPCKPTPPSLDMCGVSGRAKTKLQVAFVVDRTGSFLEFFRKLGEIIKEFYNKISKTFPGSEIALTTFGDFTGTQRYDESDSCYTLDQSFTMNLGDLASSIGKILRFGGMDLHENSLQAMMLTCADLKIGWNNLNYDSDGVAIQRVVIVMTDNDDLITNGANFKDADKRHPARGDGTDDCTNSLYPSYDLMSKVLKAKDIHVIGALAKTKDTPATIHQIFENHFTKIGVDHNIFEFPLDKPATLAEDMERAIYQIVPCQPPPPPDKCGPGGRAPTKLQVAFVVDRTSSFEQFFLKLGTIVNDFYDKITKTFPGSEIALTTFGDFLRPNQRAPVSEEDGRAQYDAETFCFTLDQLFTKSVSDLNSGIQKVIDNKQWFGDDYPENSLQAVMFTAAHRKIRWNTQEYDSNGVAIQRVIIMMTDADDLITKGANFLDADQRRPARGDGSDDCTNSLYPSYDLMARVLREKGIHMIGALAKSVGTPDNIHQLYENHFTKMNADFTLFDFPLNQPENLATDMENAIYKIIPCNPKPQGPPPFDSCEAGGNRRAAAKIQLAFVMDRTYSFTQRFFTSFGFIIERIYERLNARFPGTTVALTLFTDYTDKQWDHGKDGSNNKFTDDQSCYFRHYKFTKSIEKLRNSTARIRDYKGAGGDEPEDQLTAIMMTAADKEIGWNVGKQDKKGVFVYKVICMLTDADSHTDKNNNNFKDERKRRAAKGDGSDTCKNSLIPTHAVVAKALKKKGIRLIGLLSKHYQERILEYWEAHFNKIGVPHSVAEFKIDKVDEIFDTLIASIKEVLPCDIIVTPTPPPPIRPPTSPPTGPPTSPPIRPPTSPTGPPTSPPIGPPTSPPIGPPTSPPIGPPTSPPVETPPPPPPSTPPPPPTTTTTTTPKPLPPPPPPTTTTTTTPKPLPPPPPPMTTPKPEIMFTTPAPPLIMPTTPPPTECMKNRVPSSPSHSETICIPEGSILYSPPGGGGGDPAYGNCLQDPQGNFVVTENCPCNPYLDTCGCDPNEDCDEWDPPATKMGAKFHLQILFALLFLCLSIRGSQGTTCAKTKLQIAFVIDRTTSLEGYLSNLSSFMKIFHERVSKAYPGTEIAITSFGNFTSTQRIDSTSDQCYKLEQKFTQSLSSLLKVLSKIRTKDGNVDFPENSLQAIMFTSADKKIGWTSGEYDSKGMANQRLIIMMTDDDDIITTGANFKDAGKRHPAKGDGTDTCKNSLYPGYSLISNVLKEKGISHVILALTLENLGSKIVDVYNNHFNKIGLPHSTYQFQTARSSELATEISRDLERIIPCTPKQDERPPPVSPPQPPPLSRTPRSLPQPSPPSDACGANGRPKTKLQVAFVADRTGTFEEFLKKLPAVISDFHRRISKTFPGSALALTSFADFDYNQRYDANTQCYTLDQTFSTSMAEIERSISKIRTTTGNVDYPENKLQAIMFTCADRNIGWSNMNYDSDGAIIQRVIVLFTDADDFILTGANFKDASQRHPARGDGSDTCTNSLYPDYNILFKVLDQRGVLVIGALAKSDSAPKNLPELYTNHFSKIGLPIKIFQFETNVLTNLAADIESSIYSSVPCKPTPKPNDICSPSGRIKTKLQIAFVADRTGTFKEFLKKLPTIVNELYQRITKRFPGSQIALTSFADFTYSQRYDETNHCYSLDQKFTTSSSELGKSIGKITTTSGNVDWPENSLQAVMFTVADKNIGWEDEDFDSDGAAIQRIVIMLTDDNDLISTAANFLDEANRYQPKGDGTDTCINSLYPDYRIMGRVINQRKVRIIAALAKSRTATPNLVEIYRDHFKNIGVASNIFQFDLDKPIMLVDELESAIFQATPCKIDPPPIDICGPNGRPKTRLQIAFVVDRTSSFRGFFLKLASIVSRIYNRIVVTFPETEMALTTFGDFWSNQRYDETNLCYTLDQAFTTNLDDLTNSIRIIDKNQFYGADIPENSLQALMLTCADTKIGWTKLNYDLNGATIQRVVILMTDADDLISTGFTFKDAAQRHPPQGDGTDTCTNSLYPDHKLISKVLKQRNVRLIGALAKGPTTTLDISEIYKNHFDKFGVDYNLFEYSLDNTRGIVADIVTNIFKTIPCNPRPPPLVDPSIPPFDQCEANGNKRAEARIQLAFVVDRTSSFTTKFFRQFGEITERIYKKLNDRYPGTMVAMTLFTDFTSRQWNHGDIENNNNFFDDGISCYLRHYKFTKEIEKFKNSMRRIKVFYGAGGDGPEDQLTAILMTAADKELGWNQGRQDAKGVFVYKRRDAKGDGTDTCENALLPKYEVISRVLQTKGIRLVGLLSKHADPKVFDYWNGHFSKLGVTYDLAEFSVDKADRIFDTLSQSIEVVLPCDVIDQGTPPAPPTKPTRPPPPTSPPTGNVVWPSPPPMSPGGPGGLCYPAPIFTPPVIVPPTMFPPPQPSSPSDADPCGPNGRDKTRLQVAFVADRTDSFERFFKRLPQIINDFHRRKSQTFPGSELGFTSFADFDYTQRYDGSNQCYTLDQRFTTNLGELYNIISKIQTTPGNLDLQENSLQAIMFTTMDKNIGWSNLDYDSNGAIIQRVIVLVTDSDDLMTQGSNFKDASKRRPAKGDGTDTCTNSLYPDYDLLFNVLYQSGVMVIGAIANSNTAPANISEIYMDHFNKIGLPLHLLRFDQNNLINLAADMERTVYAAVPCRPSPLPAKPPTTPITPPIPPPQIPPPSTPPAPQIPPPSTPPAPQIPPPSTPPPPQIPPPPTTTTTTTPKPPPPPPVCLDPSKRVPSSPSHNEKLCIPPDTTLIDYPGDPLNYGRCLEDAEGKFVVTENCPCDPRLDTCACDPNEDCDEWDPPGYNTLAF
ncbi:unnamed protein product [Orchesella dallaii]|uniref:VWFA domain-containing protein n=1 Tax=Orchesella dallaii TaxID=48710 RepID=A0ABP1RGF9_9HEXA